MKKVLINDKEYPENLLALDSGAPRTLFIDGELKSTDSQAIAIVGSRHMEDYGRRVAWEFSNYLAVRGVTIVSGLARGIDSIAHKGALAAGGRTIAVLGHGLDRVYPPENKKLASEITKSGALVTEFPPLTPPVGKNFLIRNRIVSGLSLGVLVVEGAKRSGTLSIANWAASQSREVFSIPGRLDSPMSYLPNYLIENGAVMVTKPQHILDHLGIKP